jgi:Uma2 family endonuclease
MTPPADKPDALWEFVGGKWRETPRLDAFAGLLASLLASRLNEFGLPKRRGVAVSEVLFQLGPDGPARCPNVAFVGYDRWPFTTWPEEDPPALDTVPHLAVEIPGPRTLAAELLDKIRDYFFAGVDLVWVIFPRQRLTYVYTSPIETHILTEQDELDGGKAVPGFKLPLATLFAPMVRPA